MAEGGVITVTVVDDHPAILAGITSWFLESSVDIEVVARGASAKVAWMPPGDSADVVVLDLQMSGQPRYGDLRRLADARRQVIVYTMYGGDVALKCLELGAVSFLTKAEGADHLVAATVAAAEHRPYLPPVLAGAIAANTTKGSPMLSARENEVLINWFQSESKQLVAAKMGITVKTVGTHLDRVRVKYANVGRPAPSKAALVARAIQDGLIEIDDL